MKVYAYWFTPNGNIYKITDDSIEHGGFVLTMPEEFGLTIDDCKKVLINFGIDYNEALCDISGIEGLATDAISMLAMKKGSVKVRLGYDDDIYIVYYGEKGKRVAQNAVIDYFDIFDGKDLIYVDNCDVKSHWHKSFLSSKDLIKNVNLFESILNMKIPH